MNGNALNREKVELSSWRWTRVRGGQVTIQRSHGSTI